MCPVIIRIVQLNTQKFLSRKHLVNLISFMNKPFMSFAADKKTRAMHILLLLLLVMVKRSVSYPQSVSL